MGKVLPGTPLILECWRVGRSIARACGLIDHLGDEEPTGVGAAGKIFSCQPSSLTLAKRASRRFIEFFTANIRNAASGRARMRTVPSLKQRIGSVA